MSGRFVEEFLRRFPGHADELKLQIELHQAIESERQVDDDTTHATAAMVPLWANESEAQSESYPNLPGYEILNVLGRGGMGVVYRAWQKDLHRMVALKMVHASYLPSSEALERLRLEALAIARLRASQHRSDP